MDKEGRRGENNQQQRLTKLWKTEDRFTELT